MDIERWHHDLALELRTRIAERVRLHERVSEGFQHAIVRMDQLLLLAKAARGHDYPSREQRITTLECEVVQLQRNLLEEEVACWRDVQKLEQELREVEKEAAILGGGST